MRLYALVIALALAFASATLAQQTQGWGPGVEVLTQLPGYVFDWSPDSQSLAYAVHREIFIVKAPDFSQPKRLPLEGWLPLSQKGIDAEYPIYQLLWSPDGKRLAFVSARPSDMWSTIWLTDLDGLHVQDLLPPTVSEIFNSPGSRAVGVDTWLSTKELAFGQHVGTGAVAYYKLDVESQRHWTFCVANQDGGDYWSPTKDHLIIEGHLGAVILVDGRRFKPSRSLPDCRETLLGCTIENYEWSGQWYAFDDWAPDGKRALLTRYHCKDIAPNANLARSARDLYLWDVAGKKPKKLAPNATLGSWSPDGSQIAFLLFGKPNLEASKRLKGTDSGPEQTSESSSEISVGVMHLATRAVRIVATLDSPPNSPGLGAGRTLARPLWSPDGHQLLVRDSKGDVCLVRSDGSARRPVTLGMPAGAEWSPDGKRLAVRVERPRYALSSIPPYIVEVP